MNTPVSRLALALLLGVGASRMAAQGFDSGSDGSYGELTVATGATLVVDLPPDGILHCTTVNIGNNANLRFNRNDLNTPVYLLAQGNVVIGSGATVHLAGADASGAIPGRGGPGGFDGGYGGFGPSGPASRGGDGHGPGRGLNVSQATHAVYSVAVGANSAVYGNALMVPVIGGSGGAGSTGNPGNGGGGGGGAILIASSTSVVVNGRIFAEGGSGAGWGSGGGVRIVAPTGGGNGFVRTRNGLNADGRIRIDTTEPTAFRNLALDGVTTRGRQMFVFQPNAGSLHLVEVAGQGVALDAPATVTVTLPVGAPLAQTVRVRTQGFTGEVPVRVVVTPEHSASTTFDLVVDASANPPEASVEVTMPVGEPTRIEAWTR